MAKVTKAQKMQIAALSVAIASASSISMAEAIGSHQFNVKTFGATGNGTTDDTAAIQAALTAASGTGAQVVFPSGTYLISSSLTANGVAVVGSGATLTTAQGGDMLVITGSSPSVTGMGFTSTNTGFATTGIFANNATNASVTSNSFGATFQAGIVFNTVTGGTITANNLSSFSGNAGIGMTQSSGITITKNQIATGNATNAAGIATAFNQSCTIQGNALATTNTSSFGVESSGDTSMSITKNTVSGYGIGILSNGDTTPTISYNVITGAANAGIVSRTNTNDVLTNNTINNSTNDAIRVNGSSGTNVTTNSIDGAGGNAVQAANGGNINITNNSIGNVGLTNAINAVIFVNNTAATAISITANQYKGNTTNIKNFIHVDQTIAAVSGNKTNSLLPTVVGP